MGHDVLKIGYCSSTHDRMRYHTAYKYDIYRMSFDETLDLENGVVVCLFVIINICFTPQTAQLELTHSERIFPCVVVDQRA